MQFTFAVFVASAFAGFANAYTTPVGNPTGNPIATPGLNQVVPEGQPFNITWQPTTPGTVTLVLLQGPSTNIKPLYPIAQSIPNNGYFEWTPKTDLTPDVTHYGLQLIVDASGQYQYSTQFGLSAAAGGSGSGSASASETCTETAPAATGTDTCTETTPAATYSHHHTKTWTGTAPCSEETKSHTKTWSYHHRPTGTGVPSVYSNGTSCTESATYSVPTAPPAVSTTPVASVPVASYTASSPPAVHTGGAAGKGVAALGAVLFGAAAVAMGL
jgi:hypothetical protein